MRCIGVFYSKPFENFIAPHTTEYRYNRSSGIHVAGINNNQSGAVASANPVYNPSSSSAPGTAVPEPLTILGAATAAGFGAAFKRRLAKAKDHQKAD